MDFSERFSAFTVLIANINRSIRRIKSEEMAEFNLKSPHVSCLYYLRRLGAMSAKELGDICGEDKASLSRSIDHLEREGYIECSSSARKRYKTPLALTECGAEVADRLVRKIDGAISLAGEGMDEEEREIFYRCLSLVNDNLERLCTKYDK